MLMPTKKQGPGYACDENFQDGYWHGVHDTLEINRQLTDRNDELAVSALLCRFEVFLALLILNETNHRIGQFFGFTQILGIQAYPVTVSAGQAAFDRAEGLGFHRMINAQRAFGFAVPEM